MTWSLRDIQDPSCYEIISQSLGRQAVRLFWDSRDTPPAEIPPAEIPAVHGLTMPHPFFLGWGLEGGAVKKIAWGSLWCTYTYLSSEPLTTSLFTCCSWQSHKIMNITVSQTGLGFSNHGSTKSQLCELWQVPWSLWVSMPTSVKLGSWYLAPNGCWVE